ncbi:hypothetical protein ILYODFUR_028357, partial [Ilyodon furcidens]
GPCAAASGPAPSPGSFRAPGPSTTPAKQRICLFRVEEDEEEEEEQDPSPLPTQVILRRKPPSITNRLTSRKSAPVLNQIFEEEGESDDDFEMEEGLPPKLSRLKMNIAGNAGGLSSGASPGPTQKRYHRRKSQGRGSSCSSSETSDDDSESHRRRLDKDSGFTYSWNRRDSSEGPPGSEGGNGGGSSSGQGKPPSEGGSSSGPDKGSPGAGGNGEREGGGGGGGSGRAGGGNQGQDHPSSCCSNSSSTKPSLSMASRPSRTASRGTELVESLKLMSLCLSSQLQQHRSMREGRAGGAKVIIDPQGVKVQEKSAWRICIGSTESLDSITLTPTTTNTGLPRSHAVLHLHQKAVLKGLQTGPGSRDLHSNMNALKNSVLQLPLCEKTISVNIQRGSRDGLLCTSAPASCCQVI